MTNPATFTARVLLRALVDLGVRDVVLCPGSRSAPLAFAAVAFERAGKIRLHVRHDERVGAFTALGVAKISTVEGRPRPAVVITTSGTATANLHPAVLEAAHSHLPLIVLTADRPHELRGVGANQTTDQVALFGSAARWSVDIPARETIVDDEAFAGYFRNLAARAVAAALGSGGEAGPVHLNLALREPLIPDSSAGLGATSSTDPSDDWLKQPASSRGLTEYLAPEAGSALEIPADSATVVLAGDGAGPRAREVAEAAGWPLFAEPSSGARSGENAVGPYRLMLGDSALAREIDRVVVFGHATLSRPIQQLLARTDIEVIVVHRGPNWPDPPRRAQTVASDVQPSGSPRVDWLARWQEASAAARAAITRELGDTLNGPNVAQAVVDAARAGELLWFGSSNPVRDADLARPWSVDRAPLTAAHRGLAGIDGTISAATGAALASGLPTRILTGDLTFIHDLGALVLGPLEAQPSLQIVVFDDNGGGIFETLEQGAAPHRADFERIFGTPHGMDLANIVQGMGWPVTTVSDMGQVRAALTEPITPGLSVLIIAAQRGDRRAQNQRLAAAVSVALAGG